MEIITIYFDGANKRPLYAMLKDNKYQFEEDWSSSTDNAWNCSFDLGKRPFTIFYDPESKFWFQIDHKHFGWCNVDLELDIDYEIVDVSI